MPTRPSTSSASIHIFNSRRAPILNSSLATFPTTKNLISSLLPLIPPLTTFPHGWPASRRRRSLVLALHEKRLLASAFSVQGDAKYVKY